MDGENNGSKPYFQMDDLGGNFQTPIFGSTPYLPWKIFGRRWGFQTLI